MVADPNTTPPPTPVGPKPVHAASGVAAPVKAPGGKVPGPKVPSPAPMARAKTRHWGIALSFILLVLVPFIGIASYLYLVAADQYASRVGFSVRTSDTSSAVPNLLGELGGLGIGSSSSTDTDILYEFIQSQELVSRIDADLDLRALYSKPEGDPVFAFDPDGAIEDLTSYWADMVRIFYDAGSGLIELRVHAFTARDAQTIARAVVEESTLMINELSAIAQQDATGYAREDLDAALERLKTARQAVTEFRSRNQLVDPTADIAGQVGLLTSLQGRLAQALIERRLLAETAQSGDPRIEQADRTIRVIEQQIEEERRKFGLAGETPGDDSFVTILGEFERLQVEREFAEQTYLAAQSAFTRAVSEAQRQSRYLAAYIQPTLPERALYPRRTMLAGLAGLFLLLGWAMVVLVFYAVKDRR